MWRRSAFTGSFGIRARCGGGLALHVKRGGGLMLWARRGCWSFIVVSVCGHFLRGASISGGVCEQLNNHGRWISGSTGRHVVCVRLI